MNALINSQRDALKEFAKRWGPDCPIRFDRYTGQDNQEQKQKVRLNPPHILLTNYVMLEYMLLRPWDRDMLHKATGKLRFLVADEVHVYRGRQGADVAMLLRRLRQTSGREDLVCVGTSATISTSGGRDQRRAEIAETGSRLFGVKVEPQNVIDESLRQVTSVDPPTIRHRRAPRSNLPDLAATSRACEHIRSPRGSRQHLGSLRKTVALSGASRLLTARA